MNQIDFYTLIQTRLGGNLIDVELTYDDIDAALRAAILTYRTKGNDNLNYDFYAISVDSSTQIYDLPTEIDEIIKVISSDSASGIVSTGDPFDIGIIQSLFDPLSVGGADLISFEMLSQRLESISYYTVGDLPFQFKRNTHQIQFLKKITGQQNLFLETYRRMTDDEYRDVLWIQEWALAEAKIILGRAYQKYSSVSTPAGDTSLNGNELIQEGRDDKERLLTDIKNYNDTEDAIGSPIIMG